MLKFSLSAITPFLVTAGVHVHIFEYSICIGPRLESKKILFLHFDKS